MIPKICAIGLLAAILSAFLGELGFKSRKLFSILASLMLFTAMKDGIITFVGKISSVAELSGIGDAYTCALKAVGLGYLFGIVRDVCAELGEGGIAKAVSVVGRVEILLVALPYFEKTIALGLEVLK